MKQAKKKIQITEQKASFYEQYTIDTHTKLFDMFLYVEKFVKNNQGLIDVKNIRSFFNTLFEYRNELQSISDVYNANRDTFLKRNPNEAFREEIDIKD